MEGQPFSESVEKLLLNEGEANTHFPDWDVLHEQQMPTPTSATALVDEQLDVLNVSISIHNNQDSMPLTACSPKESLPFKFLRVHCALGYITRTMNVSNAVATSACSLAVGIVFGALCCLGRHEQEKERCLEDYVMTAAVVSSAYRVVAAAHDGLIETVGLQYWH